jgi:ABC-type sugar transport system ATPase subunit/ribose/xylose/arabinose/galactoside ABC-type transport system permease subunit
MAPVVELPQKAQSGSQIGIVGLEGASKVFGGTIALRNVSFSLCSGEVLALLGENGAGKSTCVKLLAGLYRPSLGALLLDGQPVEFESPATAQRAGVAVMHQHPGLFPDLTVAENIFMGHMPHAGHGIDRGLMSNRAVQILSSLGFDCDPEKRLNELRTSEQQLVEVARALSLKARVIIMDEPTAALSQREVTRLFAVVSDLKARGAAILFVGHRMDEIYRLADRIAVLRDGALVGLEKREDLPRDTAIKWMVGRELSALYPVSRATKGDAVLEVRDLSRDGEFEHIDLTVHAGEIVGLGGLVGSGRTEIARTLFGVTRPTAGSILIKGKPASFQGPRDAMAAGVAYVSEDRLGQSLVTEFSILANAALTILDRVVRFGLFSREMTLEYATPHLARLKLRYASYDQPVSTLSGGNQQKVVLAKWLATQPKILILDEPTQGVDVQAKAEVHAMIADLARQDMAILLISSEMPELIGMCDRIAVLHEGRKTAEFLRAKATQEAVLKAAADDAGGPKLRVAEAGEAPHERPDRGSTAAIVGLRRELGLVAAMAAVIAPVALVNPRILSPANVTTVAMDAALLMIVTLAQMLVLLTRNIDLSLAAIIGLSAYGSALAVHAHPQLGIAFGLIVAVAIGLSCGALNGAVVTYGRVPAIVVTLGTLSIYRGVVSLWAGGKQISADQVPQAWLDMTSGRLLGVPLVVFLGLGVVSLGSVLLNRTVFGRELFAIGSNPAGAALIGIPTHRRILSAFALAGALTGLTGALWASRYATIDARVAYGYELSVIAAAVVGGVAIRGGTGTVLGATFGALTLLVIRNGLTLVRVDPLWLQGVYGLVILVAIAIDAYVGRRSTRTKSPRGSAR